MSDVALIVAGGARDPNIRALLDHAAAIGVRTRALEIGEGSPPRLCWAIDDGVLHIDGEAVDPRGVFVRRDVFHAGGAAADLRAAAWYGAMQGWLAASSNMRTLNRGALGRYTNKCAALIDAREVGLRIPRTLVSNDIAAASTIGPADALVAKPLLGGGWCQALDALLESTELRGGAAAMPAIVQQRLGGPDVRIFLIGEEARAFRIASHELDYRVSREHTIERIEIASLSTEIAALRRLAASMGLDWCAADFKEDPANGALTFLEINSDPMFAAFDSRAGGEIAGAIVGWLTGSSDVG